MLSFSFNSPLRFSSFLVITAFLLFSRSLPAYSDDGAVSDMLMDPQKRQEIEALKMKALQVIEENKDSISAKKDAIEGYQIDESTLAKYKKDAELLRQAALTNERVAPIVNTGPKLSTCPDKMIRLFVSLSLGDQAIKDIFETASNFTKLPIQIVFRGIPYNLDLYQGVKALQKLAMEFAPLPDTIIDEVLYKKYDINAVPSMVLLDRPRIENRECEFNVVSRVSGISDPYFLSEKSTPLKDYGIKGPVEEIAEISIADRIQQKLANTDWDAYIDDVKKNMWNNVPTTPLQNATDDRVRIIDPTLVITADIKDSNGKVLLAKGTERNPLDYVPWLNDLIIFDPTNPKQLKWAKTFAKDRKIRVIPLLTQIDRDNAVDMFNQLARTFNSPVYILTPEYIPAFQLEYQPAHITIKDKKYQVTEFKLALDPVSKADVQSLLKGE